VANSFGGAAAVAGGGKFENGAITGAFGYLFNGAAGRAVGGLIGGWFAVVGAETGPLDPLLYWAGHILGGEFGSRLEDLFSPSGTALARSLGQAGEDAGLGSL
jgi:hypothetical protein